MLASSAMELEISMQKRPARPMETSSQKLLATLKSSEIMVKELMPKAMPAPTVTKNPSSKAFFIAPSWRGPASQTPDDHGDRFELHFVALTGKNRQRAVNERMRRVVLAGKDAHQHVL